MYVTEVVERDEAGKFIESPDSLHPKTFGVRIRKALYDDFLRLCQQEGKRPTEMIREIVEAWIVQRRTGK